MADATMNSVCNQEPVIATVPVIKPDRGADPLTHTDQRPPYSDVPGRPGSALPDAASARTILSLLGQADLDTYLTQQLCPPRLSSALLAPAQFAVLLEQARRDLQRAATRNPGRARAINRAARLLGDDIELRSLMTMYRNALLQG